MPVEPDKIISCSIRGSEIKWMVMHQKGEQSSFFASFLWKACSEGTGEEGCWEVICGNMNVVIPEAQTHLHRWENYHDGTWVV